MEIWVLIGVSLIGAAFGALMTRRLSGTNVAATIGATCKDNGADAAIKQLDEQIPPLATVPYFRVLAQRERAAMLALLGETDRLKSEHDARDGSLLQQANIDSVALVGLAIAAKDRKTPAKALVALAERIGKEGGVTMTVLRKRVEAYAWLGTYLATPKKKAKFDGDKRWAVEDVIATENGALPVLLSLGLDEAMAKAGKDDLRGPHTQRILASGFRETRS